MLSPLLWIHPGLLRAIRVLLPEEQAGISTELDVWSHEACLTAALDGLVLKPSYTAGLQEEFAALPTALRKQIRDQIFRWHARMPQELQHLEAVVWEGLNVTESAPFDFAAGAEFVRTMAEFIQREKAVQLRSFARKASSALLTRDAPLMRDASLRRAVSRLWLSGHHGLQIPVPPGVDLSFIDQTLPKSSPRTIQLYQSEGAFQLEGRLPLLELHITQPMWWVTYDGGQAHQASVEEPIHHVGHRRVMIWTGRTRVRLEAIKRPGWAATMGRDKQGLWAEMDAHRLRWRPTEERWWSEVFGADQYGFFQDLEIAGVSVRFRRIPAGAFMMGSPEDEKGRWDDEGPQHRVTLTQPFWLADTPVTQALWVAVMQHNPSKFKGAQRPVEQVSWKEAQRFIEQATQAQADLHLSLPTEAQWEYACRAGTTTPRWRLGSPEPIAWFGENSKQQTQEVRQKPANPWGLYDILGNVEEWCADRWRDTYQSTEEIDPIGPSKGAKRVVRGGSWDYHARNARAAFRGGAHPGIRSGLLGFRLARGAARSAEPRPRSGDA